MNIYWISCKKYSQWNILWSKLFKSLFIGEITGDMVLQQFTIDLFWDGIRHSYWILFVHGYRFLENLPLYTIHIYIDHHSMQGIVEINNCIWFYRDILYIWSSRRNIKIFSKCFNQFEIIDWI